ncbi:hypothetical protein FBU59_002416 [Linderina macrospora]|uniref:Uncharacterized protein n=1 Tax=Linderina macrospora TaxID=4868 RepID=A0ACC1JB35_9FUNG|nr:hypothetical protein FBU59_002416 [Linderina macrospora]
MAQAPIDLPDGKSSPTKGKFIALLRRAQTVFLFSDPIFVPDGKPMPELPEGLQYIHIHPSSTEAKTQVLKSYLPKASNAPRTSHWDTQEPVALPTEDSFSMFSSFLPTRDSSVTTLRDRDVPVVIGMEAKQIRDTVAVSENEALEIASKILGHSGGAVEPVAPELMRELGLMEETDEPMQVDEPETAQTILEENSRLLAKLVEFQDKRASSGDMGKVSKEEQEVADKLQMNMARVVGAHKPKDFRPPTEEIERAASELLAYDDLYAGTLPPQRRFAFVSNAATYAGYPPAATTVPMERPSPKKK